MKVNHSSNNKLAPPSNREEWISALMDGEIDDYNEDQLTALTDDGTWNTYHVIGDVLRSEDLAQQPSAQFSARFSEALTQEANIYVIRKKSQDATEKRHHWTAGLAVAASIFAFTWLIQPDFLTSHSSTPQVQSAPVSTNLAPTVSAEERQFNLYVNEHRQFVGFSPYRHVGEGAQITSSASF